MSPLDEAVAQVRALGPAGVAALTADDLRPDELPDLGWSGGPLHLVSIGEALERVPGEVDYLVVRAPNGVAVAKGGVDFAPRPGAGTIWQVATHMDLRSLGLGARLLAGAEERIRARGLGEAALSVEQSNPRARALYERLGYRVVGVEEAGWMTEDERAEHVWYATVCDVMAKPLR